MDQRRVETVPKVSREVVSGALETANFISPSGGVEEDEPFGPGGDAIGVEDRVDTQGADHGPQRALRSFLEDNRREGEGGGLCDLGYGSWLFGEVEPGRRGSLGAFPFWDRRPDGRLQ